MSSDSPKNLKVETDLPKEFHKSSSTMTAPKTFKERLKWFRKKLERFLEHYIFVGIMTVLTIYALFADDIRQLIGNKDVDTGFYIMASVCLAMFSLEIFLSCLAKPGYFLGFFFWLDVISTASLIFDIGWISNLIFGTGNGSGAAGAAKLARAGRASRVGTRAGRIVRVVRLIRLIRIVKLYKAAQTTLAQKEGINAEYEEDFESREGTFGKTVTNIHPKNSATLRESNNGSNNNLEGGRGSSSDLQRKVSANVNDPVPSSQFERNSGSRKFSSPAETTKKSTIIEAPKRHATSTFARQAESSVEPKTSTPGENALVPALTQGVSENQGQPEQTQPALAPEPQENKFEIPQETNVGKKLSDLTTKRVITLVMSVMISIPLFSVDTYVSDFTSEESGLNSLWEIKKTGDTYAFELTWKNYRDAHIGIRNSMITLVVGDETLYSSVSEDSLRDTEKQYYNIPSSSGATLAYSCFDQRDDTHLNAILGIGRTLFVTLVLTAAALYFSKDSNDLVLAPIESMLSKVKRIAENPLAAAQIEEEEALAYENLQKEGKHKALLKKKDDGNYETTILEKTILKLGALLALGFGEAGSNIIAQNMSKSGDVDPMIPGKKVMAIFGFCDIRQFTDATEVLQEGVMVFVDEIAEIVHGTINEFSGAANKNIGDAFLLVWKIPEDGVEVDPNDASNIQLKQQNPKVNALADMSVLSFVKVLAGINKSKKLDKYRHNEGLNQRIKNYSVKMGFGLHIGWAIEGAIGSEYKIDASYLSPNVNMAARLEAATKQFGVPILISGALQNVCTPETKKHLRHIDRVTVKGSIQPIDLYTCDLDYNKLGIDKNEVDFSTKTAIEKKQIRMANRVKREDLRERAFNGSIKLAKRFNTDKDVQAMRKPFTRDFEEKFSEGMENYISGNWSKARDAFEMTLKMLPNREKDGPSNTLLNFMSEFGFRAPHDWRGFRELTEK